MNKIEGGEVIRPRLKEAMADLGIRGVLFDLDDTLVVTSPIFRQQMSAFVERVSLMTGVDAPLFEESLMRNNNESYMSMGVNPVRWYSVVQKMVREFPGFRDELLSSVKDLMLIYEIELEAKPGAEEALMEVRSSGVKMALVTHANMQWTERKFSYLGFDRYFDAIVVANEDRHKGKEDWLEGMREIGCTPKECLVVGDSLPGDIVASASLGAKTAWVTKGSNWSMYKTGEVPEGTIMIEGVSSLASALIELAGK